MGLNEIFYERNDNESGQLNLAYNILNDSRHINENRIPFTAFPLEQAKLILIFYSQQNIKDLP